MRRSNDSPKPVNVPEPKVQKIVPAARRKGLTIDLTVKTNEGTQWKALASEMAEVLKRVESVLDTSYILVEGCPLCHHEWLSKDEPKHADDCRLDAALKKWEAMK